MIWFYIVLGAVAVIGSAVLLAALHHHNREQEKLVMRVRTTELYGYLYPLLRMYDTENVATVCVEARGITITMLEPLGLTRRYTFHKHGLDQPTPEVLYALAQAMLVDMKVLRDRRHYKFTHYKERRRNGKPYDRYVYEINPRRKSELLRLIADKRTAEKNAAMQ